MYDDCFDPGVYRCELEVRISDAYTNTYELDDHFTLTVGSDNWERVYSFSADPGVMVFKSAEIIIKDNGSSTGDDDPPAEKTKISFINLNSNYLQIAKYGGEVKQPTFEIPGKPQITIEGYWLKKENDGSWHEVYDDCFDPGVYRCELEVRISD